MYEEETYLEYEVASALRAVGYTVIPGKPEPYPDGWNVPRFEEWVKSDSRGAALVLYSLMRDPGWVSINNSTPFVSPQPKNVTIGGK